MLANAVLSTNPSYIWSAVAIVTLGFAVLYELISRGRWITTEHIARVLRFVGLGALTIAAWSLGEVLVGPLWLTLPQVAQVRIVIDCWLLAAAGALIILATVIPWLVVRTSARRSNGRPRVAAHIRTARDQAVREAVPLWALGSGISLILIWNGASAGNLPRLMAGFLVGAAWQGVFAAIIRFRSAALEAQREHNGA